jgi:MOSC domain-containing protein YiiM
MRGTVHQISLKPKKTGERGLPKRSVSAATITEAGVEGDFNRYRHEELGDDPDSALLLMPIETLEELNREGWPVRPGDLGENITTQGIPYAGFSPGTTFKLGDASIEVSRACEPCTNLYELPYVGESRGPAFLKVMLNRRGWYARVLRGGRVAQGDSIASTA